MKADLSGLALLDPWFLLAVPLAGVVIAARLARARAALPSASLGLLAGLPRTLRARLVQAPLVLEALAVLALGLALARPVTRELMPLREVGVDLMLVVDLSSSMRAPDMNDEETQTRIAAVRDKALEFAATRTRDRLGLLTFARFPELRCPFTLDQKALAAFVRGLETVPPGSEEDRTGIGAALAQAVKFLRESQAKSKVVVLLTDGQENVHEIEPLDAAKLAKDAGVKVHTIGAGRSMRDMLGREVDAFGELKEIAKTTGGKFFRAGSAEDLGAIYRAIDELEKVQLEDPRYRTKDWFVWPLAIGGALLALALALEGLLVGGAP